MRSLRLCLLATLVFAPYAAASPSLIPASPTWGAEGRGIRSVDELEEALARAGENRAEIERAMQGVSDEERTGMRFLVTHMPEPDLRSLSADYLIENVRLAYTARREAPWSDQIPEAIFLNDILPYAQVNEARESWRPMLRERFAGVVAECETPGEAAQRLNETIFKELGVKYSTKRNRADQAPSETVETGLASCTGLSILLADTCRAVGVPARLAGIPSWVNKPGNHTWVEVWDGGWHFTGAAEPDGRGLNHGWFQHDASLAKEGVREHAIYAASWGDTGVSFPLVWAPGVDWVSGVDVSHRYTGSATPGVARLYVRVLDAASGERVAAEISLYDPEDSAFKKTGTSRDESVDLNDLLTFELPHDRVFRLTARDGDRASIAMVEPILEFERIVTLQLPAQDEETDEAMDALMGEMESTAELYEAFQRWYAGDEELRGEGFPEELTALLATDEANCRELAWKAYQGAEMHAEVRADFEATRVREGGYESPYTVKEVGERPEGGWPLFIAMHGGGGAPKEVNDSQWRHMQIYYKDHPEVGGYKYVALRAPNDTWNGFYTDYAYPLVARLIRNFLLFGDVDPDRVFLMGYSHGGYGAFAIGPTIPDRFAAVHASAAAPTGGETSGVNLRNTVFTYMVGEKDTAYGRADRCKAFAEEIEALRGDRTDIYPVTFEYQEGYGHGGLPDRDKVVTMYPNVREPLPRVLAWEPMSTSITDFFWLSIPESNGAGRFDVSCEGNRVQVRAEGHTALTLHLDSRLVDVTQPLVLEVQGETHRVNLHPSLATLAESMVRRGDPRLANTIDVDLRIPE